MDVDQTPIGRTPRSTPATYTGVFDEVRRLFARTKEANVRGYKANRFSFNVKGGRCETCQGQGQTRVEMQFLADLYVTCATCGGRRFNAPTLEVRYRGLSIADVLDLRVDDAVSLFEAVPKVARGLASLHETGLGYVTLGQPSTTLSGGEAQRVKLAAELGRPSGGRTLYVLDEPTTGLHFSDVENLIRVLGKLADLGHAVVVIEHNLDVIRSADWVVDLGPEGGERGGNVVAMGPPDEVARNPASLTGMSGARGACRRDSRTGVLMNAPCSSRSRNRFMELPICVTCGTQFATGGAPRTDVSSAMTNGNSSAGTANAGRTWRASRKTIRTRFTRKSRACGRSRPSRRLPSARGRFW